jgi:hypothetical protein
MPSLARRNDSLRFISTRLSLSPLETVARTPGISEAYRITMQYHDGRVPDQVATLSIGQSLAGRADLSVCYRRTTETPLTLTPLIPIERARALASGLRALGFDRLDDMPDLPWHGADLWLIERAVGTFSRDVVLAPESASGPYAAIVTLVNTQLHEAIRPLKS